MLIETLLSKLAGLMPVLKTLDGVLTIVRRLQQWGHLIQADEHVSPETVASAIASYQERWGLKETGLADAETVRLMARRYCGCPDFVVEEARGLSRWASREITFSTSLQLRQADVQAQRDQILSEVFAHIGRHCGLNVRLVSGQANVMQRGSTSRFDPQLDGGGGTLAYAYLPRQDQPTSDSLNQIVDLDERWSRKMLWLVVAHETCHNLGLSHNEDSSVALMDPHLNMDLDGLQPWDIAELVKRYGQPASAPIPPTQPPSSGELPKVSVSVEYGGRKWVASGEAAPV